MNLMDKFSDNHNEEIKVNTKITEESLDSLQNRTAININDKVKNLMLIYISSISICILTHNQLNSYCTLMCILYSEDKKKNEAIDTEKNF